MTVYSLFLWNTLFRLNNYINNFQHVFFAQFKKLIDEPNQDDFVNRIADYIRLVNSMYMFVRVERPVGSKNFVLAHVKCDWVFSFSFRFEKMRLLLCRIPPTVLVKTELTDNKALRLACVGETDYEQALTTYRNDNGVPPLVAALRAKDEDAVKALLDGGDDPNEVGWGNKNALLMAAWQGCRLPLFRRILGMTHNVNAGGHGGMTALMWAAHGHLDMVVLLMNQPGIDVNVQDRRTNYTALHYAVEHNRPDIIAQLLSNDMVDTSLKDCFNETPLMQAIDEEHAECVNILRDHGALEE